MSTVTDTNVLISGQRVAHGASGDGESIILIYGIPSSSYIWRNIAPKISDEGYKVHVFDLLGYGASEPPHDQTVDTSVMGQVSILKSLILHWNLNHAHILAHDIGGAIAQRFCLLCPMFLLTVSWSYLKSSSQPNLRFSIGAFRRSWRF